MAIEVATGRLVVLAICEAARLGSLSAARGLTHRHLTSIIDVMREVPEGAFPERVKVPAEACVAIAEHVPGRSLFAALAEGQLHAAKAVAWTLRLADAVQALHAVGAVHGAVSPRSVLAAPEGRAIAPVLSELVAPPVGAFCPPERLRGATESPADDVWALYATLYAALTGRAPFKATTREGLLKAMGSRPPPLTEFGVEEPALQEIIARGLVSERRGRTVDLAELVAALDGWERDPKMLPPPAPPPRPSPRGLGEIVSGTAFSAGRDDGIVLDDSALPDDQGRSQDFPDDEQATTFAKLPASVEALAAAMGTSPALAQPVAAPMPQAPAVAKRPSINPFARKGNVLPWLLGGVILVGGGVYIALAVSKKTDAKPAPAPEPTRESTPQPKPAAPAVKKSPEVSRDECIVAHFEQGAFEAKSDLAFVCQDGDFRETAGQLHAMVKVIEPPDAGSDASAVDAAIAVDTVRGGVRELDAGAHGSPLGWYELPATAIIRRACCPGSAPITLPETPGWCEQLQVVVRRMADDSAKSVDLAPLARNFDKAVGCLYAQRIRHGYAYDGPPTPGNRASFQQFLGRAAIISTKR
jgi:hypothetical protein